MIAAEAYVAFCLAALALAAVPGPTVTVIIANSLRFGARAGLLNVAGTIAAGLVWLALATLGLGAAIRVMGIWFDLLRYAGAIYLIWLGLRLLFSKGSAFDGRAATGAGAHGFFWQGFVVLMSNPKVLVLFGMLIPPFLGANGDIERGTLLLGGTFIVEFLYSLPGLGRLMVNGIQQRDYALVQGATLFIAFNFVLVNLLVDLVYAAVDPRISYRGRD